MTNLTCRNILHHIVGVHDLISDLAKLGLGQPHRHFEIDTLAIREKYMPQLFPDNYSNVNVFIQTRLMMNFNIARIIIQNVIIVQIDFTIP